MTKKIANLSLKGKFLIITLIIVLVALGLPSAILYQYYYKTVSSVINESYEMVVQNRADVLGKMIEKVEKAAKSISDSENAVYTEYPQYLQTSDRLTMIAETVIDFEIAANGSNIKSELERYQSAEDYLSNMIKITCGEEGYVGHFIVMGEYPLSKYLIKWNIGKNSVENRFVSGIEIEQEDWYRKVIEEDGDFYWFVEESRPEKLMAAKLLTYRKFSRGAKLEEKQLGILVFTIDMTVLKSELNLQGSAFGAYSYLIDENNILAEIYSDEKKDEKPDISYENLRDLFGDLTAGESVQRVYGGIPYYLQKNELSQGMDLCTLIPVYDIQMMDTEVLLIFIGLVLAIFCMVMIALRILNYYLVKPVVNLSEQMRKRELDGKVDEEIRTRTDEIGTLYREYASMQEKIQQLIGDVWREAEEKRKKEVMALQMQINPHFVFNTLGTFSCYALMNGQDDFAKQLSGLSSILRYYTRNPEKIVPLREEIAMIKQYEELQQMSRKEKLVFRYNIDRECEDFMIPKLIIQPLVENAILYGTSKEEREIEISAALFRENELIIVVRDSGKEADVEWINRYISGQCEKEERRESFGIKNVYERLGLIFGEKGLLTYRKDENGRTMAIVRIGMEQD